MKFVVKLTEHLSRQMVIEAQTQEEAINKIEELYANGDIVIDYDDVHGDWDTVAWKAAQTEIECIEEVNVNGKNTERSN